MTGLISYIAHPPEVLDSSNASHRRILAAVRRHDEAVAAKEMAEHAYAQRIHDDFMSGVRSGVNGTPTFYVNSVRHDDSWDTDTLLEALERAASS